jgi:hypothetical protein
MILQYSFWAIDLRHTEQQKVWTTKCLSKLHFLENTFEHSGHPTSFLQCQFW